MRTECRNVRCREALDAEDQTSMHVLAPLGFCPSCRLAILFGFKVGAGLAVALGLVIGGIVKGLLR